MDEEEDVVKRMRGEIEELRQEIAEYKRTVRELNIQVETIQKSEEAHIARTPWRHRGGPSVQLDKEVIPGEGDY